MKSLFFTLSLSAVCTSAFAQTETTIGNPKAATTSSFSIGATSGIERENLFPMKYSSPWATPVTYSMSQVFMRYNFNKHMSLQTGIGFGVIPQKEMTYGSYLQNSSYHPTTIATNGFVIENPVSLQYHFFSPKARLRPYIGVGTTIRRYYLNETTSDVSNGSAIFNRAYHNDVLLLTATQGLTWQVNKHWQVNQSLTFMNQGKFNALSLQLGVSYKIGK
ncbi:MAG: outer membrane beta-barrel protein [Bacteroidetes bacterium]|nr:outer membrane beta-barrel protein [Bacteroidota bacterium]